jgi:hypothetical protein
MSEFLLGLIEIAKASEFPEYGEYWIWLAFVIGNVLMFIPSFGWTDVDETDDEWYARICKNRDEQKWMNFK